MMVDDKDFIKLGTDDDATPWGLNIGNDTMVDHINFRELLFMWQILVSITFGLEMNIKGYFKQDDTDGNDKTAIESTNTMQLKIS